MARYIGRVCCVWQPEVVINSGFFSVVRRTSWRYGGLCENIANFVLVTGTKSTRLESRLPMLRYGDFRRVWQPEVVITSGFYSVVHRT